MTRLQRTIRTPIEFAGVGLHSGQTVKVHGEELLVMREEDIMGVVEGA